LGVKGYETKAYGQTGGAGAQKVFTVRCLCMSFAQEAEGMADRVF